MLRAAVLVLAASFALSSCGGGGKDIAVATAEVAPGTFSLNTLPDKRLVKGASSARQMLMDGYTISVGPVTEGLWAEVMGGKADNPDAPKAMLSYNDCIKFTKKLSKATGRTWVVPSEAMWEYAYKNGVLTLVDGAKEWTSSVAEDVSDARIVRDAKSRESVPEYVSGAIVFRVAVADGEPCPRNIVDAMNGVQSDREHVSSDETVIVNGVKFPMVGVPGGAGTIGATAEQGTYGEADEKPVHVVDIEGFELGRTEVTVAQWLAVMDVLPLGNYEKEPEKPVINVSWFAAQEYILKLNSVSGRKFRLPSEAEWEYAARGGAKTGHFRYAGSNRIDDVAVYTKDSDVRKVQNVATKMPNELGLYDMSGNAWEWCIDRYALYGSENKDDASAGAEASPSGAFSPVSSERVMRGGSAASAWKACRVSNRSKLPADNVKSSFGFRLAL